MQQAGSTADWTLAGMFGPERWHRVDGRFAEIAVGAERIALPTDGLTLARLRVREGSCGHAGPFPLAFRFCPECGTALDAAPAAAAMESWSAPFGTASGLPSLEERRAPDLASHAEIPVPESAALGFVVAGTPPMLLACDRVSGWISGWSERDRRWIERVQVAAGHGLPSWSFAAGAAPGGLALPTDRGPAWLGLTDVRSVPVTTLEGAACAAGAAALRARVAVPIAGDDGMAVAVLDGAAPASGWVRLPVRDAAAEPLAAPVVSADAAFWCGASGLLTLQATADGLAAGWQPWRDGLRPLPGVRPVMEPGGTLHQLAREDPRTLVLEGLTIPGQTSARRVARGYTPGTGRAVFRENVRLRLPWDEREAASYLLPDDSFLLPLLGLDDARYVVAVCEGRSGLGRFLGDPGADAEAPRSHVCTLFYSRGPRVLEPLDCVLRARHAWELSMFVHAGWLYAHGALENRCHRWRLVDAE